MALFPYDSRFTSVFYFIVIQRHKILVKPRARRLEVYQYYLIRCDGKYRDLLIVIQLHFGQMDWYWAAWCAHEWGVASVVSVDFLLTFFHRLNIGHAAILTFGCSAF